MRHRRVDLPVVIFLAAALAACAPTVIPAGPPVLAPRVQETALIMQDGAELALHRWQPEGQPSAVVLALHGFNETGKSFALPGAAWVKEGVALYAYDQRGFGASPHRGIWPGTESLVADLETATVLIAARHPGVPLYVLGESMGGAVVMVASARGKIRHVDGAILVAPAVRGRETLNVFARAGLWVFAHTVPWLAGYPRNTGITPTDNKEALRALARDPLVIKDTRIDAVWGLVNLMDDALGAAAKLERPALILLGARDDLVPDEPTDLMLRRLPPASRGARRVAEYRNGYHMLLRDLNAEIVHRDVVAWIESLRNDPARPLPSGAERGQPLPVATETAARD
ncbi:MAG TPA: lysophospholipase [Alphaproteobacteria bacterium]|nr:lysophospholipase [Alphaproteobacteria bacterium]